MKNEKFGFRLNERFSKAKKTMITNSPPTRRLTGPTRMAYIGFHVHPHTSNYRHHFHCRSHGMQDRVFQRLFEQKELVQAARCRVEGRAESYRYHRPAQHGATWRRTARDEYGPERNSWPVASTRRRSGRSCGAWSDSGDSGSVGSSNNLAAARNLGTRDGFSCREVPTL